MPCFRVLHLLPEDAERAAIIDAECFTVRWPAAEYTAEMERSGVWLGALENDRLVGVAGFRAEWPRAHIVRLAVCEELRRQGIGALLTARLLDEARIMRLIPTLEVRESNLPALALYRSAGFQIVGRVRGYYFHPSEDAVILELRDSERRA